MKINLEKATKITNVDIWLKVAPPKGGIAQWEDGYSAKELAKFVIEHPKDFSKLLEEVVKSSVGYIPSSFTGEPEATTNLPYSTSGPREHDLLLYDKRIVIGIEAKVDEPFGNNKSIKQEKETTSEDKPKYKRINWLMQTILPGREIKEEEVGGLRYQLFTATAGTLLEAYEKGKSNCILLVFSFHEKDKEANPNNKEAFKRFVNVVCGQGRYRKEFIVKRDGDAKGKPITCWFIERDITFTTQTF